MKFYQCSSCEKIVSGLEDKHDDLCQKHTFIAYQPSEQDIVEHPINIRKLGNFIKITVTDHPMIELHHLIWMMIETSSGMHMKRLTLHSEPSQTFILDDEEEIISIYVNCSIHHIMQYQNIT